MLTERATSKFARLGAVKVHYNEAGEGEALIFTVGYAPGASGWAVYHKVIGPLSAHFRCLLLDPPNCNKSAPFVLKGEPRSTMYARTIRDFMDALGIEQATIVDMSFGAQTGQVFALEYPRRLSKLVLHACSVRMPAVLYNAPTDAQLALRRAFAKPSLDTMRAMMHLYLYNGSSYTDEELMLTERLEAWLSRPELDEARKASDNIQININEELKRITAPSLLIFGRDDRVLGSPEGAIALLNYLQDARLVILGKCGHWIPFERPEEFSRLVSNFVKHTRPTDAR